MDQELAVDSEGGAAMVRPCLCPSVVMSKLQPPKASLVALKGKKEGET